MAKDLGVFACYQCKKCSVGCVFQKFMDKKPHEIIRLIQLGKEDEAVKSITPWLCASCETCVTRCPNDIDIPRVMDDLKRKALEKGVDIKEKRIYQFYSSMLNSIKSRGRVYELGMIVSYKLKSGDLFTDAKEGLKMFLKGKISILPESVKDKSSLKKLFKEAKGA